MSKNKLGVINMLIFALLLIIVLFICGYAGIISVFGAEYRYIKMEMERASSENEYLYWRAELKKLRLASIPIIGRFIRR